MLRAVRAEALAKEVDGRPAADEIGDALVERPRPLDVERVVKQLVKDDFRQCDFIVAQKVYIGVSVYRGSVYRGQSTFSSRPSTK